MTGEEEKLILISSAHGLVVAGDYSDYSDHPHIVELTRTTIRAETCLHCFLQLEPKYQVQLKTKRNLCHRKP